MLFDLVEDCLLPELLMNRLSSLKHPPLCMCTGSFTMSMTFLLVAPDGESQEMHLIMGNMFCLCTVSSHLADNRTALSLLDRSIVAVLDVSFISINLNASLSSSSAAGEISIHQHIHDNLLFLAFPHLHVSLSTFFASRHKSRRQEALQPIKNKV
eukprot:767150-Hanusia_phi.AAC.2